MTDQKDFNKAFDYDSVDTWKLNHRVALTSDSFGSDPSSNAIQIVDVTDKSGVGLKSETAITADTTIYIDVDEHDEVGVSFSIVTGAANFKLSKSIEKNGLAQDDVTRVYHDISVGGFSVENDVTPASPYTQSVCGRVNTNGARYLKAEITGVTGTVKFGANGAPRV